MLGPQDVPYRGSTWLTWVNVACVAGAENGKGEGKIGRARNVRCKEGSCPFPRSARFARAQFFPFPFPF